MSCITGQRAAGNLRDVHDTRSQSSEACVLRCARSQMSMHTTKLDSLTSLQGGGIPQAAKSGAVRCTGGATEASSFTSAMKRKLLACPSSRASGNSGSLVGRRPNRAVVLHVLTLRFAVHEHGQEQWSRLSILVKLGHMLLEQIRSMAPLRGARIVFTGLVWNATMLCKCMSLVPASLIEACFAAGTVVKKPRMSGDRQGSHTKVQQTIVAMACQNPTQPSCATSILLRMR